MIITIVVVAVAVCYTGNNNMYHNTQNEHIHL